MLDALFKAIYSPQLHNQKIKCFKIEATVYGGKNRHLIANIVYGCKARP